ncbi:unnamed protein product [Coccothraustes coccothraustes]
MPEALGQYSCVQDFSIYSIETIVMCLLNTVPVSWWHRRHFVLQLVDILVQLCLSLENFIVGNQRLLEEISLPLAVQTAEPPHLFHRLTQDPAAHSQAMEASINLRHRLARVPVYGYC